MPLHIPRSTGRLRWFCTLQTGSPTCPTHIAILATIQIKIIDEGPGVHLEELPQLFERFYQGYSDRQAKGSGLGLYLSRQIVEAHGGTIWAENRIPRGVIFGFCIPARLS